MLLVIFSTSCRRNALVQGFISYAGPDHACWTGDIS